MTEITKYIKPFRTFVVQTPLLGAIIPVLFLVIPALLFLPQQSLWTDETTTLSGLTLGPFEIIQWLTGQFHPFDVPGDNMPPVSYWVGMLWASVFGITELSMRYFALFVSCISVAVVFESARFSFGFKSGLLAGLLYALSPNIIEQAVNIRVYPVFLLVSTCCFYFFIRLIQSPQNYQKQWLIGLSIFSILAIYTHLFGLLLVGSIFLATLISAWKSEGRLKPVFMAIGGIGVAAIGFIPFLLTLFSNLGRHFGQADSGSIRAIVRLIYRQFGHPTMMGLKLFIVMAALGFCILLILVLLIKFPKKNIAISLFTVLGAGFIIVLFGRLLISPLVTEIRYNLWMFPGICILLSSSICVTSHRLKTLSFIALSMVFCANLYAASQFILNGNYYSRSRFKSINSIIQDLGVENVSIVHDGNFGSIYFPIRYTYGEKIVQYVLETDEKHQSLLKRLPHAKITIDSTGFNTPYVILLKTDSIGADEISLQIKNKLIPLKKSLFEQIMEDSRKWESNLSKILISYSQTDLKIYHRIN